MDASHVQNERESLAGILASIEAAKSFSDPEREEALFLLEQYECWGPFFDLIKTGIEDPKKRKLADYVRLAKAQNLYLEDVFAASDTCATMIAHLSISHSQFNEEVLSQVIEEGDYTAESSIRSTIWDKFAEKSDQVTCLERLTLLYEKKTHNDSNLAETYETLLEVDPDNVKALRYFKLVYSQNNEWEEVVKFLNRLLVCVKHRAEKYRVAQELSVIFLYQLDMPKEAIEIIQAHCEESPLDTSTILYDAYHRMNNWQGCLQVLREALISTEDDTSTAVLHYKIAGISTNLEDFKSALENYQKAADLWPDFIDAYEGIISSALRQKKFEQVLKWLEKLKTKIHDETLIDQLKQASKRLKDGMAQVENA